ncbi:MAG TPA: Rieske (2Fe-2S) protein [Gaiellales bacterium]|jgi:nitrite reductase/ring-hydroxylating ferredoxin subunit
MTSWHPVELRPDAPDGALQGVRVAGYDLVFLHVDGELRAYEDECPHVGCRLSEDGELVDGVLICNCHGAEFEAATGALLEGPAETPLEIHAVRIVEGRVEVEI